MTKFISALWNCVTSSTWTWEWFIFFFFAVYLTTQRFKQGHHCELWILSLLSFRFSPASENLFQTFMSKIQKILASTSFKRPLNLLCSYAIYTHWCYLPFLNSGASMVHTQPLIGKKLRQILVEHILSFQGLFLQC